jgi:hypothetical protein
MAEIKIRLTDTTSVSEIADFFKGLNDTQTVRARQTKDGAIELYVRGSSKWHLLTDNLKFGFLVTRDYQAAQEKIDDIFKQNGVIKSIKAPQTKLTSSFSNHQHDFYVREIKTDFQNAKKVITQQEISRKNVENYQSTSLRNFIPENLTDIVEYLANEFETTPSATLEFIKFIQLAKPTINQPNKQPSQSVELDFEQIENFAIEWQKLMAHKKLNSIDGIPDEKTQDDGFVKKSVTENFINKITAEICKNIPMARVDFKSKPIDESDANILILDSSSKFNNPRDLGEKVTSQSTKNSDDDDGPYQRLTVDPYNNVKTQSHKEGISGFYVEYSDIGNSISDEEILNLAYEKLDAMIENKIKEFKADGKICTVHLSILNPFNMDPLSKTDFTPEEQTKNLNAFVKHTSKWLAKYPNLRIQIQPPENTTMEKIEEAYQLARHEAHKNQEALLQ